MKSREITHIIFSGPDGVGKDTIKDNIWQKFNHKYALYVRGDFCNYVYAKKFNRPIIFNQNNLPFLHVILIADKHILAERITFRKYATEQEYSEELAKVNDVDLYVKAYFELRDNYHAIVVDVSDKDISKNVEKVYSEIMSYIDSYTYEDDDLNSFNQMYKKGCDRTDIKFKTINNQPYFNNARVCTDYKYYNGGFETYSDDRYPVNLVFSLGYDRTKINLAKNKEFDFVYPINSKLLYREEILNYFDNIATSNLTLLTTDVKGKNLQNKINIFEMDKVFGEEYIEQLSRAKANFYSSREMGDFEYVSCRLYESILANNVIFVDRLTDKRNVILNSIFYSNSELDNYCKQTLRVDEATISQNYKELFSNENVIQYILIKQRQYYNKKIHKLLSREKICYE